MREIIMIQPALPMDGQYWNVGMEMEFGSNKKVTEIKDTSSEFENGIHIQYDIYVEGQLWKSLVNMPVQVTYAFEGESE